VLQNTKKLSVAGKATLSVSTKTDVTENVRYDLLSMFSAGVSFTLASEKKIQRFGA
jgi:hypothetical protein